MKLLNVLTAVVLATACSSLPADGSPPDGAYLVVAKAVSADLVRDNSFTRPDGSAVIAPMTYKVRLKLAHIVYGPSDRFPKTLDVNLDTRNVDYLLRSDLHLLIDLSKPKEPRVLNWGTVSKLVCLPAEMLEKGQEDSFFNSPFSDGAGRMCTFLP